MMSHLSVPRTPSFSLDGRRALVVGASRGIGFALAAALGEAGAHLTICARQSAAIASAGEALRDAGYGVRSLEMDVTDDAQVKRCFVDEARFDIVVNSAGMARHSPAMETDPDNYDQVMAVNCRGAYFLACAAARSMREHGGSIIQVSSQMGLTGGVDRSVYCASKHALEGMSKAMAVEWGQYGIRVNTICPTFVRTELTRETLADPEKVKWIESRIKLGRIARPEDVMGAVVFLASDASSMVTGTHLLIDGGWTAG